MNIVYRAGALVVAAVALSSPAALADPFAVTDLAGRQVSFDKPVERVILGEGRMIYGIAPIETNDPFGKIVGWRNDLWTTDLDGFNAYVAKYPKVKDLPFLGNLTDGTLQTETVVKLRPDVLLLPIGNKSAADEVGLEKMLGAIGVKLVYIDFREKILKNTVPSLTVLGKLFGKEQRAADVAGYWQAQIDRVTTTLKAANPAKPNVFMYRAARLQECCGTFGTDNYGLMVELAGGRNTGSDFLPGYTGTINPEQVIKSNPDIVVATGSNWTHSDSAAGGGYVVVGPGAAAVAAESRAALAKLIEHPAFTGSKAVAKRNVHAIWHQFYTSPYQFVAIQQLAKWFHPELFKDLDPDATFADFSKRFLPLPYAPGYWVSLAQK